MTVTPGPPQDGQQPEETSVSPMSPPSLPANNLGKRYRGDVGEPQPPRSKVLHNTPTSSKAFDNSSDLKNSIREGEVVVPPGTTDADALPMPPCMIKRFLDVYPDLLRHILSFFVSTVSCCTTVLDKMAQSSHHIHLVTV